MVYSLYVYSYHLLLVCLLSFHLLVCLLVYSLFVFVCSPFAYSILLFVYSFSSAPCLSNLYLSTPCCVFIFVYLYVHLFLPTPCMWTLFVCSSCLLVLRLLVCLLFSSTYFSSTYFHLLAVYLICVYLYTCFRPLAVYSYLLSTNCMSTCMSSLFIYSLLSTRFTSTCMSTRFSSTLCLLFFCLLHLYLLLVSASPCLSILFHQLLFGLLSVHLTTVT